MTAAQRFPWCAKGTLGMGPTPVVPPCALRTVLIPEKFLLWNRQMLRFLSNVLGAEKRCSTYRLRGLQCTLADCGGIRSQQRWLKKGFVQGGVDGCLAAAPLSGRRFCGTFCTLTSWAKSTQLLFRASLLQGSDNSIALHSLFEPTLWSLT